ncbi:Eukaryotic translation initiation factor eIF-2C4 [Penicillium sp. DV-2018c]|nr:Eukaryotic translation initiation factor eIF-2C4 [Penicillium sp. DV-2018c]
MAPPKPQRTSDEKDNAHQSGFVRRPVDRSSFGSSSSSSSSSSSPPLMRSHDLPHRDAPEAKPLTERQLKELRDHRARLEDEARRKKEAESTAWMRRIRVNPDTGEKWPSTRSTGSNSGDSDIRRVEAPSELPAHWTAEERENHERLVQEGMKVAVYEQHRINPDKISQNEEYMTIHWDEYKNIDIPWHRFRLKLDSSESEKRIQQRKGYNTAGREIEVVMNAYPITAFPMRSVYQSTQEFDEWHETIAINGGITRELIIRNRDKLADDPVFEISLILRRKLNLAVIAEWLQGRRDLDVRVMESLSYQAKSRKFSILGSLDRQEVGYADLSYQGKLLLNVDVAHCVFYSRISLMGFMMHLGGWRDKRIMAKALQISLDKWGGIKEPEAFTSVSKAIYGLRVMPNYEGCPAFLKGFLVKGLLHSKPREEKIMYEDKVTGTSKMISVEEYFLKRYDVRLEFPEMVLVEMQKEGVYYPAEFLVIKGLQKYRYKLKDHQAASMIEWCATRPQKRLADARQSKDLLQHNEDPMLKHYGMKIGDKMITTKARLLPSPDIQFGGNAKLIPKHTGKWDLRGKKFYQANEKALEAWGVGFLAGDKKMTLDAALLFVEHFIKMYRQMGGVVRAQPVVKGFDEDVGQCVKKLYNAIGIKCKQEPQLMIWIVPNKDPWVYHRIKRSADCRYGCPSQVVQSAHCLQNKPQYHANVLMKVNAKLGGITARVVPKSKSSNLPPNAMFIGADVTHPMQGVRTPSLAAMSVSSNSSATRYMGGCEINGDRVEVIHPEVVLCILKPLVAEWRAKVGNGKPPQYVYYFRDGVSAGEYRQVLSEEVSSIRHAIAHACGLPAWEGKICVIVANKRHHLRAFPNPDVRANCDPHGGPLPGTLIDRDVTSPHDWDFLLYTHVALQGTARPVHYHVLLDEMDLKPNDLECMINDHCYQYIRSTTSVSVHPAIYYAHLISVRARQHEDVPIAAGLQHGAEVPRETPKDHKPRTKRLLPIEGTSNRLALGMWYV